MRFWRHIVAVFVALVFASSSSLAAMSLVWCVGADGHRAIEYKIGSRHADHQSIGQRHFMADAASEPEPAADHDCKDSQLIGKAKISPPQADDGLLTFDVRVAVALPMLRILRLPDVVQATHWRPPAHAPPDPQRAALRSVVLLI